MPQLQTCKMPKVYRKKYTKKSRTYGMRSKREQPWSRYRVSKRENLPAVGRYLPPKAHWFDMAVCPNTLYLTNAPGDIMRVVFAAAPTGTSTVTPTGPFARATEITFPWNTGINAPCDAAVGLNFRLSDFLQHTLIDQHFDRFFIDTVTVKVTPGASPRVEAQNQVGGITAPLANSKMYARFDPDNIEVSGLATIGAVTACEGTISQQLTSTLKPLVLKIKPNPSMLLDTGNIASPAYSAGKRSWIDCAYGATANHFGAIFAFTNMCAGLPGQGSQTYMFEVSARIGARDMLGV